MAEYWRMPRRKKLVMPRKERSSVIVVGWGQLRMAVTL